MILCTYFPSSRATIYAETMENDKSNIQNTGDYKDGNVIVTLATPDDTNLTQKGKATFDSHIVIDEIMDFGDADVLAKTSEQKDFLDDKTFYVSEVSSDTYSTSELIEKLQNKAYVMNVEPDYYQYLASTDDTYSAEQWYLDGEKTQASSGISFSYSKDKPKSASTVVAVMDSGINYNHEDLKNRMWTNSNPALNGTYGYNFVDNNSNCMDDNGHGTHCAGVIAATANNQIGISGISTAQVMAVKVFSKKGKATNSSIIKGLNYIYKAQGLGVPISAINCSWGGGVSSDSLSSIVQAIGKQGALFIFAAGNSHENHNTAKLTCPYDLYTGKYPTNRNYIIIVGASTQNDTAAEYSDYGSKDVDIFAPGNGIFSAYIEPMYCPGNYGEQESSLTSSFLNFGNNSTEKRIYTDSQLGISSSYASTLSADNHDCREQADSGSLHWHVARSSYFKTMSSANLYYDVTDLNLDPAATYYISLMVGGRGSSGFFSWEHLIRKSYGKYLSDSNRFFKSSNGKTYLKLLSLSSSDSTVNKDFYLDNIGISTANPTTSNFGEYDYMTGTSMAAPMVTGAVALLSELYPTDTSWNRKSRLLTCHRSSPSIMGLCSTSGILDLSQMDSYDPTTDPGPTITKNKDHLKVTKITISSRAKKIAVKHGHKRTITIKKKNGYFTISPGNRLKLYKTIAPSLAENKNVRWKSSNKKWARVSQSGIVSAQKRGRKHTVTITAIAMDGSRKKGSIKIKIR